MAMMVERLVATAMAERKLVIMDFRDKAVRAEDPDDLPAALAMIADWRLWAADVAEVFGVEGIESDGDARDRILAEAHARRGH
jgi:hypothetical protein